MTPTTTLTTTPAPSTATRARRAPGVEVELFGPGDLLWELNGHWLFAATTGSAFILQVMHPAIGAVVDRWSTYRTDPWGRAARSFASVQTWIYGGPSAIEEGHRLRDMHSNLAAVDEQGRKHHALSAEPWAWVPLTAYHAALSYARYFTPQPLHPAQEEQLYREILRLCRILQVPERMLPANPEAYWAYFDHMIDEVLENHPTAHNVLAVAAHSPPIPGLPAPLRRGWPALGAAGAQLNRLITVGTLPPAARDKLNLPWSTADERALRVVGQTLGRINTALPERVRYMPIAYRARQADRAERQLAATLANRPR
jgi:uncharacterized protein (DUF2236 family)